VEGKAKAVRRLEMVLRHLNGQIGSTAAVASLAMPVSSAARSNTSRRGPLLAIVGVQTSSV
jgi:hypothetical protein